MEYADLFRLDGQHAVVVGAGSGMGRESAKALSAFGARVTCADIAAAEETAGEIGGRALTLDVRDAEAVARAATELDPVDVLVFTPATNVRKRMVDLTPEEFERVIGLNLRASFQLIRCFGAVMAARGRGSIIGFSSIRAQTVEPGQGAYAATKAGLEQLVRTAASEFGRSGVRVNAIRPGVVDTPLTAQLRNEPEWYDAYARKSVFGRWARAEEIAGTVVYLASSASSYVTGAMLAVDGGWTAHDGRYDPPLPTN